eukprot:13152_1
MSESKVVIMTWLLISFILYFDPFHAAILSFKSSDIPDQYCLYEFSWHLTTIHEDSIDTYCDDIDNILNNYCANTAFFANLDSDYTVQGDPTNHECFFNLDDHQTIMKTYVLSDQIPVRRIVFSSSNELPHHTTILLSQSFLSIASYSGSIHILGVDFTSTGNIFPFINIASDNIALDLTMQQCQFTNFNAEYGSIVHVPRNEFTAEDADTISIVFDHCIMVAQDVSILYVERNNVYATFSACDISGSIMHWICQQNDNGVDLCGDVFIFESTITQMTQSHHNLFSIDLSMDPAQTQFALNVTASVFTNINGVIFNFNHNDDVLGPSSVRIQEENAFIHILGSRFEDNGPIFMINSWAVPFVTIEDSSFSNNAALSGSIIHWYCSRKMRWISKENHCGSIVFDNSTFDNNYGSFVHAQIRDDMQFNLAIVGSTFMEHTGNIAYLEESTAIPYYYEYTDGNTSGIDIEPSISVILVDNSQFINCICANDDTSDLGTIFTIKGLSMVGTQLLYSSFEGNECTPGASVLVADYAPLIDVSYCNFTHNGAITNAGIFDILEEDGETNMEISDSRFVDNGWWGPGPYDSEVTVVSAEDSAHVSLNIARCVFIQNEQTSPPTGTQNEPTSPPTATEDPCDVESAVDWNEPCVPDPGDGCGILIQIDSTVCVINGVLTRSRLENSIVRATKAIINGLDKLDVVCTNDLIYLKDVEVTPSRAADTDVVRANGRQTPASASECPKVNELCGDEANDEPQFDVEITVAIRCDLSCDDLRDVGNELLDLIEEGSLGDQFASGYLTQSVGVDKVCNIGLGRVSIDDVITVTLVDGQNILDIRELDIHEDRCGRANCYVCVLMGLFAFYYL